MFEGTRDECRIENGMGTKMIEDTRDSPLDVSTDRQDEREAKEW